MQTVPLIYIVRYLLLLFIITMTASTVLSKSGYINAAFLTAPYRKDITTRMITTAPKTNTVNNTRLILFFHRLDPDIRFALANTFSNPSIQYRLAISLDPYNYSFWQQILTYYWHEKEPDALAGFLCSLIRQTHPQADCGFLTTEPFTAFLSGPEFVKPIGYLQGADGLAKFYYFLGLTLVNAPESTDNAVTFFTLARDAAPHWGYYHLELASAYYYRKHSAANAQEALAACARNPFARRGCDSMTTPSDLEQPGFFASDIAAIPAIQ